MYKNTAYLRQIGGIVICQPLDGGGGGGGVGWKGINAPGKTKFGII